MGATVPRPGYQSAYCKKVTVPHDVQLFLSMRGSEYSGQGFTICFYVSESLMEVAPHTHTHTR